MPNSLVRPQEKSLEMIAFVHWMRTGRILKLDPERKSRPLDLSDVESFPSDYWMSPWQASNSTPEQKFGGNPYHDELGKFTSAGRAVAPRFDSARLDSNATGQRSASTSSDWNPKPVYGPARGKTTYGDPNAELRKKRQAQEQNLRITWQRLADKRVSTFLDLTASLESGGKFDAVVGGGSFKNYSRHPNIMVGGSTAAGAYQFNHPTWTEVSSALGLADFSPQSQRYGAAHLMGQLGVVAKLQSGDLEGAIYAAGRRWQVFPLDSSGRRIGNDENVTARWCPGTWCSLGVRWSP